MNTRVLTTVRHHVAALVAVVALLAQVVAPHVHVRHPAPSHSFASDATLVRCDAECPTALRVASDRSDSDGHAHPDGAGCPLCRAQTDARSSLLPASIALPLPAAAVARDATDVVVSLAIAVRSLAAPRAPPAVS